MPCQLGFSFFPNVPLNSRVLRWSSVLEVSPPDVGGVREPVKWVNVVHGGGGRGCCSSASVVTWVMRISCHQ